jgi:hypothetical protein
MEAGNQNRPDQRSSGSERSLRKLKLNLAHILAYLGSKSTSRPAVISNVKYSKCGSKMRRALPTEIRLKNNVTKERQRTVHVEEREGEENGPHEQHVPSRPPGEGHSQEHPHQSGQRLLTALLQKQSRHPNIDGSGMQATRMICGDSY